MFYPDLIAKLKEATTSGTPCFVAKYRKFPIIIKSIVRRLDKYIGTDIAHRTLVEVDYADVMIYAIRMQGLLAGGGGNAVRRTELSGQCNLIFGGLPVRRDHIDAMQFVMRRSAWLAEGGWSRKEADSDGFLYEKFSRKYPIRAVPEILGEHW